MMRQAVLLLLVGAISGPIGPSSLVQADEDDAPAPPTILKGRPDAESSDQLLGPVYESQSAGISFRPPADATQIKRGGVPDEVVQYVNEDENLALKVSRFVFSQPLPLTTHKDQFGREKPGML